MSVMTDSERAALVEEMMTTGKMTIASRTFYREAPMNDKYGALVEKVHVDMYRLDDADILAHPIVQRILAERDMDALLDSVPGMRISSFPNTRQGDGKYHAGVYVKRDGYWVTEYWGTGPTRTAALRNAVAAARDQTP